MFEHSKRVIPRETTHRVSALRAEVSRFGDRGLSDLGQAKADTPFGLVF